MLTDVMVLSQTEKISEYNYFNVSKTVPCNCLVQFTCYIRVINTCMVYMNLMPIDSVDVNRSFQS